MKERVTGGKVGNHRGARRGYCRPPGRHILWYSGGLFVLCSVEQKGNVYEKEDK